MGAALEAKEARLKGVPYKSKMQSWGFSLISLDFVSIFLIAYASGTRLCGNTSVPLTTGLVEETRWLRHILSHVRRVPHIPLCEDKPDTPIPF